MTTSLFSFAVFQTHLRKSLLPSLFLLGVGYLACLFFWPDPTFRMGLAFGFILGHLNLWSMAWLIAKMLTAPKSSSVAGLAFLLVAKVLVLFGCMGAGFYLLQWSLLAMAMGYFLVLFVVVLGVSFGYKPPR